MSTASTGRQPGQPSLSGEAGESPIVHYRLPRPLHARAVERAERDGVSLSKLGRIALETYLERDVMRAFEINGADIRRCPKRSMLPAHYRADGTCKCRPVAAPAAQ